MVWQRLEHANIAKFYGVSYQMGDRPSLVMQWYRNGTAVSYLKGKQKEVKLSMVSFGTQCPRRPLFKISHS